MLLLLMLLAPSAPAQARLLDTADRPVALARVIALYADGSVTESRTSDQGAFTVDSDRLPARIRILAAGYAPLEHVIAAGPEIEIPIRLRRAPAGDSVTVTASRAEVPVSRSTQNVVSLSAEELSRSPAITLDDQLRRIPGFTLFRRTSSLVAHPTAQGVSLRGVGPSGASRSLVLADALPLNDPFGGWVYWGRIPRLALERVEVLRGGASELYGTDALGGVVQLFRRRPLPAQLLLESYFGSFDTSDHAFYGAHRAGRHGFSLSGEFFRTGGYQQVAPGERGAVDIAARSRHRSIEGTWDMRLGTGARVHAAVSEFSERRGNGTPLQTNDTQIFSGSAGASLLAGRNEWNVEVFALRETFDASFSAISGDRTTEILTRLQRVPAQSSGILAFFRRALDGRHLVLAGADFTVVKGASDEIPFIGGVPAAHIRVDGSQNRGGFYLQDLFRAAESLEIVAGIRLDTWDSHSALSPKLAARLELSPAVALRGSLSRAFRAPTLNELNRPFRVGNIVTEANPALGPERATSGEVGLDWALRQGLTLRATAFHAAVEGNIANVTLSASPSLIRRQRRNLGDTRSRGIELDAVYRPDSRWLLSAGYFLSDATVRTAPGAPELAGLRVPQVPTHQGVLQAGYAAERGFFAGVQLRVSSLQYDDDRNLFPLGGYGVLDISAGRPVHRHADLFFACENLLDRRYAVGRTPVLALGMPRRVHGGLRFHFQ